MKRRYIVFLLALSLIACESRSFGIPFFQGQDRGEVQQLTPDPDSPGRYLLKEPVFLIAEQRAFYLRYSGGGPAASLRLLGTDTGAVSEKPLPQASGAELYLPLEPGKSIAGIQIIGPEGVEVLEAGIATPLHGIVNSGDHLTVGADIVRFHRGAGAVALTFAEPQTWSLRWPGGARAALEGSDAQTASAWQLSLVMTTRAPFDYPEFRQQAGGVNPAGAGEGAADSVTRPPRRVSILIEARSGADRVVLRHGALAGTHSLHLYQGMIPFVPDTLVLTPLDGAALWLERLDIAHLAGEPSAPPHPLPADPGAVLLYDPRAWRRPDYELFSWSRFPEVLIMDTASYEVQSRFFKRLAFFVEKRGYRGLLVENREFAGLHGFNAHDYRAEDLARFFQAAREQSFPLNPEEELLREILLGAGIIRDQGSFSPGRGAILSISRGSYPLLRRLLLTHECAHGIFFSLPELREASFAAWERLSEREKAYWRLFFRWMGYDTDDPYLTVNEYQAYLFQQPRAGVRPYLAELTASRLISSYPQQAHWVRELVRSDPERFTRAFDRLEIDLRRIAGIEGGRVIELELMESK